LITRAFGIRQKRHYRWYLEYHWQTGYSFPVPVHMTDPIFRWLRLFQQQNLFEYPEDFYYWNGKFRLCATVLKAKFFQIWLRNVAYLLLLSFFYNSTSSDYFLDFFNGLFQIVGKPFHGRYN